MKKIMLLLTRLELLSKGMALNEVENNVHNATGEVINVKFVIITWLMFGNRENRRYWESKENDIDN